MQAKEVTKILGINRDRIKYFRKQGVFESENLPSGNKSPEYTDTDVENLKTLIVLTKSGLTCGDIKKLQAGEWTLGEAIITRREAIEDEMRRMTGSLALSAELLENKAEFNNLPTERYWNVIAEREAEGEIFIDAEDMYGYRPVSLSRDIICPCCGKSQEVDLEDYMYDESSYEKDNGMGLDMVYSFDSEECIECLGCEKVIKVSGWIREYPIGAYDSESIDVKVDGGGLKVEKNK
jgi:DNA-binding transcriptional MerR regulator